MTPEEMAMPQGAPEAAEEQAEQAGSAVTIAKLPDGTFTCNDQPAKTLEEALQMAAQLLQSNGDYERQQQQQGFEQGLQA